MVALSRELSELDDVVATIRAWQAAQENLAGVAGLIDDPATDAEMRALAEAEREEAETRLEEAARALQLMLLPKDAADDGSAILEVRAGTGGDEAALFAGDLFRMYSRYAEAHGWRISVLSQSEGAVGGYKEVVAEIVGRGVFARLKFESGVASRPARAGDRGRRAHPHLGGDRRRPAGGGRGRPRPRRGGPAHRHDALGRRRRAARQHEPIRPCASPTSPPASPSWCRRGAPQHKNKARAMQLLRAKLYDLERTRADAARAAERKAQVGSGDRSERIRTYNFPQGRVTDHRINLTLYKLDAVLSGEALDEVVDALTAEHQAALLAEQHG